MEAVVSLLDPEIEQLIHELWDELEEKCALFEVQSSPIPHITWHAAVRYDRDQVNVRLQRIASGLSRFDLTSSGLGIFTGAIPVIYIPVSKTLSLLTSHQQIWDTLEPIAVQSNPYYATAKWVPHITLAYGDVTPGRLACSIEFLAFRKFEWVIHLDNLALISQEENQLGRVVETYIIPNQGQK